jgi:ABC-type antimicrobial peptide transport system permease subunit
VIQLYIIWKKGSLTMRIDNDFYTLNALPAARELVGKLLCLKKENGEVLRMRITETEAYMGVEDTACHASKGKTERNAPLWSSGGHTYVYLCYGMYYMFNYVWQGVTKSSIGFVGQSLGLMDMASMGGMGAASPASSSSGGMGGMGGMGGGFDMSSLGDIKILSLRGLGGIDGANSVSIYPLSFDNKDLVTKYLDLWNGDGDVTVNGVTISADEREDVTYTDALELVINLINTMIDAISTALIAFTSVSLVVSTVMIGIITYVSVVERIKEIGVIRSLGGRKRDVGNLFRCETLIIGLLSGLLGVGITYIASAIVSAVVYSHIGIAGIAALPVGQAALLVLLSVLLTSISGVAPASSAARKDPVVALRTE